MEIRVLGPLAVVPRDSAAAPAALGPAQRRLLAVLCVNAGQVVSSERIADTLGLKSTNAVRTTVHRLRHATGDLVKREPPGYLIEPQCLDSCRFAELLDRARAAQPDAAIGWFDEALSLWRGSAYVEFGAEEWAIAEAVRLDELHATARADRIAALIADGRITDAAADAEQLVHDQPLRERPRAQLMLSLNLQGRQTEALRAYQAYRTYLIAEAGVEPSAELAQLERRIATGEMVAGAPTAGASPANRFGSRPTGTVTFLFTDVEGSTARWEADADGMSAAIAEHDDVLRTAIEGHGGYVFSTAGDAFAAAFADPAEAVAAAVDAQRGLSLPVRMGVHTGNADERAGDYFGPTLNRAARVMGAAHGGQVLLSAATSALVRGVVDLIDLGEHRLKDLQRPVELSQVGAEPFPPLRTLSAQRHNLPLRRTEMFGRAEEIARIAELLFSERLVTLVGGGGVGKTRVALATAAELIDRFTDGVFFVDLSPLTDPSLITHTAVHAAGLTMDGGAGSQDSVLEFAAASLAERDLLLIVDNCEHLIDDAADFIDTLLEIGSATRILATSRQPLDIEGECVMRVPRLETTAAQGPGPAVELFINRAAALGVDVDAGDPAVAQLCAQLDGIPLAIELAAAQSPTMTPGELLQRLDERFELLSGGRKRRGGRRQRTLGATLDWSWELLGDHEREVLAQLSVFVGDWSLKEAEAVCTASAPMPVLLRALVDKSLVESLEVAGTRRFRLLESIRLYARTQLDATGSTESALDRHTRYFGRLARARAPDDRYLSLPALAEFDACRDNIRAAFERAVERNDESAAAGSLYALKQLFATGLAYPSQGQFELIETAAAVSSWRSHATMFFQAAADAAIAAGRPESAEAWAHTASSVAEQMNDPHGFSEAIVFLVERTLAGAPSRAEDLILSALHRLGTSDRSGHWAMLTAWRANVALAAGDIASSKTFAEQVLAEGRPDGYEITLATVASATADLTDGQPRRAAELLLDHQDHLGAYGLNPWWLHTLTASALFADRDAAAGWDQLETAHRATAGAAFAHADLALACSHAAFADNQMPDARALLTAMRDMPLRNAISNAQHRHLIRLVAESGASPSSSVPPDLAASLAASVRARAVTLAR